LDNYCDPIEAQLHSDWAPIATPLLPLKSLVVDYQRVTKPFIFAIFATTGNFARKYCKIRVKKTASSKFFYKIKKCAKVYKKMCYFADTKNTKDMKRTFLSILVVLLTLSNANAASYEKTNHGIKITTSQGMKEEVMFYSSDIVRIIKFTSADMPDKKSYPVIMTPQQTDITYKDGSEEVTLATSAMNVCVNTKTGEVSFASTDNKTLLKEKENSTSFTPFMDGTRSTYRVSQKWILDNDEAIYGLGQRQSGLMNQRKQHICLQNSNTNICIPYFTSVKGYGLYWDNPSATNFDDDDSGLSFSSVTGDLVDYYFMYKDGTSDGVISCLHKLTGKSTMFPLWALGYWQCRERYASSDELCDVVDYYRQNHIPLDGIVQDWQYWGCDKNWNAMRFMNPHYINKMGDADLKKYLPTGDNGSTDKVEARIKSPEAMVDYVHSNNAHLMISIWPDFGPWTPQYKELKSIGALYGFNSWPPNSGVRVYDAFNPKARDIYWKYLSHLYNMGMDAWWTDSTEPDHLDYTPADELTPTADGTWRSVQNAFPLETNRGIYEHQRAMKGNNKRSLQMTRSAFLGIQHYGTFSWSGDIVSNWETFKNQIPAMLNYMLCGIPMWSDDLGGFFGWEYNNDSNNSAMQELQVRWMQWGSFMPLMRNHCSGPLKNEIYRWGKPGDWAYDCQKKSIELRYRLLPYMYSQLGSCYLNDETMARPFVMDFPTDKLAINAKDSYMLGHSLLVKPVTDNLFTWKDSENNGHTYADVKTAVSPVKVYLPKGNKWFDFWTNKLYEGGQEILRSCSIDVIPVFVKAGSIIPFGPSVQYSSEKKWDNLELRVYPGADADYTLYEDEGDSYNYEKGAYTTITFHWDNASRTLTIGERKGKFKGMLKQRNFRILMVNGNAVGGDVEPSKFDATIKYNGEKTSINI
jgi:alpha-D-xyloside xylohydrolase